MNKFLFYLILILIPLNVLLIAKNLEFSADLLSHRLTKKRQYYHLPINNEKPHIEITTVVTGYNTVVGQTDGSPCISADGTNICNRTDVIACPYQYRFGTFVKKDNRVYSCHDRTANKFNGRFDISFDKDVDAAIQFGKQIVRLKIYN